MASRGQNKADFSLTAAVWRAEDEIRLISALQRQFGEISVEDSAEADGKHKELTDNSAWKGFPDIENNQVYKLGKRWSNFEALTLDWELDEALKLLTAK